jgi:hypothetical protein
VRTYEVVWRLGCGVIVVSGVAIGLAVLPGAVWLLVAFVAVIASLTAVVGYEPHGEDVAGERRHRVNLVLTVIAGWLVLVAIGGLAVVLGVGVLFSAMMMLLACSPSALRWYGALLRRKADPQTRSDASVVSTSQLCREWLDSYQALSQATSATARLHIVMARQRCLDELERRDPDGFQAWLASAASAGGDPSRFLNHNGFDKGNTLG